MQPLRPYHDVAAAGPASMAAAEESLSQTVAELDAVIAELEGAATGSRSLDARIHFGARVVAGRGEDMAALLIREGISWPTVEAALDEAMPHYTTSLDAALEGERIVFVLRSETRGQWGAMQREAGAEIMAWAATEPLARRLAALRSWRAAMVRAPAAALLAQPAHEAGVTPAPAEEAGVTLAWPDRAFGAPENGADAEKTRADKDWEVLF